MLFQVVVFIIILKSNKHKPETVLKAVSSFTMCAVIFALIELVKTLSCRILSLRVNSESLFETLQVRAHSVVPHLFNPAVSARTTLSLPATFPAPTFRPCRRGCGPCLRGFMLIHLVPATFHACLLATPMPANKYDPPCSSPGYKQP